MSDLEQRLTETLALGAQGAPPAIGLAAAARSRARARRRTRLAGTAAVVALAVGLPAGVWATQGSGGSQAGPGPGPAGGTIAKDPAAAGAQMPGGFHYESWHEVTIEVPDTWAYGSLGSWCAGGGALEPPRIGRPGGLTESIACSPGSGYGVTFSEVDDNGDFRWPLVHQSGDSWPADAYVGARGLGGVLVEVDLPDLALAQQILDSAELHPQLDPNGCPVADSSDPVVPAGTMAVCRYDATGRLEQSELLSGTEVAAAEAALRAAPDAAAGRCGVSQPAFVSPIRMSSAAEDASVDLGCGGVSMADGPKRLTPDILYWALSPGWSGSLPAGVSLPSGLRTQ
jgi:hypothetical protein